MKKHLFVALFTLVFLSSCKKEYVAFPIVNTDLEITLWKSEITYNKNASGIFKDNEVYFGKDRERVKYEEIEASYFPTGIIMLKEALSGNDNIQTYTLKNDAFGVSYETKPDKKGDIDKNYIFYFKKGDRHYKFTNNDTFNDEMQYFDHVKEAMESLK